MRPPMYPWASTATSARAPPATSSSPCVWRSFAVRKRRHEARMTTSAASAMPSQKWIVPMRKLLPRSIVCACPHTSRPVTPASARPTTVAASTHASADASASPPRPVRRTSRISRYAGIAATARGGAAPCSSERCGMPAASRAAGNGLAKARRGRRRRLRTWSDVDEMMLERVAHELGARGAVDLLLDVRAVRLDRARGEEQLFGDLGVGVPESDQAQDLDLAFAEVVRRPRGAGGLRGEPGAEARVEVVLPDGGQADRLEQLLVGRLLEHEAERAGLQRLAGETGVVLHRQHDDVRVRGRLAKPRDRLQP